MNIKRSEVLLTILAVLVDAIMIFAAFFGAYQLRAETEILQVVYLWPLPEYLRFVGLIIPFWIVIFALAGLYRSKHGRAQWGQFTKVFMAVSSAIMFVVAWVFLSRTLFFSRLIIIYAWVMAVFLVFIGRLLINALQRWLFRYNIGVRKVIIMGLTDTASTLKHQLETEQELGYKVVNGLFKPGVKELKHFLSHNPNIDEIIVADSEVPSDVMLDILAIAEEYNITFRLVPNLFEVKSTNVDVETLAAVPIIGYRRTSLTGWAGVIKRIFDIVMSTLAIILLSPILLLIACLIKIDSPGPILYRHKRIGYGKRYFYLYKFRTMKQEYCTGDGFTGKSDAEIFNQEFNDPTLVKEFEKQQKLKNDPRVTSLGNILRKTSLDELPQFFNVFVGNLSLVGPRPIVQAELSRYGQYRHRLFIVKPGVTGLWQVSGRSDMPYNERVKLDMFYIENWSLWNDIIILVKTVFVMLFRKNAY